MEKERIKCNWGCKVRRRRGIKCNWACSVRRKRRG